MATDSSSNASKQVNAKDLGYSELTLKHQPKQASSEQQAVSEDGRLRELNAAIRRGNLQIVKNIIKSGIDINRPVEMQKDRIHGSISRFKLEVETLESFPKSESENLEGFPIFHAAECGKEMTQLLLEVGANVNYESILHCTTLLGAASRGDFETVELLVAAGANVNAEPGARWTPLGRALESTREPYQKSKLLLERGADANNGGS
jgi:ankyrin repeat protein